MKVLVTPYSLTIFRNLFEGIAEEMGVGLARSAFSPNIRERLDFSCALFDRDGRLLAQAAHIPVHLGSMPELVRAVAASERFRKGDVLAANDPFVGGTHLPDITLIQPLYDGHEPFGFAAARAHHADVGGMSAGSMGVAREIFQEGLILPVVRLLRAGQRQNDVWSLILRNVRTPREREGDLLAQLSACRIAQKRLDELLARYGSEGVAAHSLALLDYSEELARRGLRSFGRAEACHSDHLEFEGELYPIHLRLTLTGDGAVCDFTGSSAAVPGPLNAPYPVTCAGVYYCFQCLLGPDVPANDGAFRPVTITAPEGSVVRATFPAAVAAGNVETSQRVVDVVLGALAQILPDRIPAASAGTMNNLAIGGRDPSRGTAFAYYETLGGGAGGGPGVPGASGIQVHMTNTRNTPAEAIETETPLRVRRYSLRTGSGGRGRCPGGEGIVREIELLAPCTVSLLAQRRLQAPPGAAGGEAGLPGEDRLLHPDGRSEKLPAQFTRELPAGSVISLHTPGGGGWGCADEGLCGSMEGGGCQKASK
ncbi:MAG: hydantoinase B/oxoprolinase family protein [Armatimonadetes bacterium]|nr:hydantoinase B/oxoprolinase family protein [Armatimonadota bacterium]